MKTIILAAAIALTATAANAAPTSTVTNGHTVQCANAGAVNTATTCRYQTVTRCYWIGHPKTGGRRKMCHSSVRRICFQKPELHKDSPFNRS